MKRRAESELLAEPVLRAKLLERLAGVGKRESQEFLHKFDQFHPGVNKPRVLKTMVEVVGRARVKKNWGSDPHGIVVGRYEDEATYNTLLLHEGTHGVLDKIAGHDREVDYEWEEPFCYDVAQAACETLGLPYNPRMAEVGLAFSQAVRSEDPAGAIERLMETPESRILGFGMKPKPSGQEVRKLRREDINRRRVSGR